MDAYEATRIVFSRIQNLDPENASKIMGLLLIQDHGEKEMIRLAFGPETLVQSVVLKARKDLALSPSTPSSPSPFLANNNSNSLSRQNSSSFSSSRLLSNLSPSSASWAPSPSANYSDTHILDNLMSPTNSTPTTTSSASYAAVVAATVNGFKNTKSSNSNMVVGSHSTSPSDLVDEFQIQDQLSFLHDHGPKNSNSFYPAPQAARSPAGSNNNSDAMLFPPYWEASGMNDGNHRRSCSVTDMCMGSSDPLGSSLGWKPCLYFARGYCKNGTSCKFLHGVPDSPDSNSLVGSPLSQLDVMEQQCQELLLLRSKSQQQQQRQQQQQQLRSQLMASSTFPYSPTSAGSRSMNLLLQQQNDTRAALMLGEDAHKFSTRSRIERSEFLNSLGGGMMMNPASRQIYLTFPADSTFREEDVSNYFSIYGPVQDVRIPYQQKRMFGFVTFVYAETVKLILAKGNPHFVCDARVLVKPYKEKGKVPDKKQQQMERGEFSVCTTPSGLDCRDPYDLQLGGRMFNNTQDVLLRRKLEEQVELQQAIELQSRRFMGLQLLDVKKHHQRNLSSPSPTHPFSPNISHSPIHQSSSDRSSPDSNEENFLSPAIADKQEVKLIVEKEEFKPNGTGNSKESPKDDESVFHNGLEHNLPDSPFASPTKSGGDAPSFFSTTVASAASMSSSSIKSNSLISATSLLPATSTMDMASFNARFFQIPRFSSDHGAIAM